MRVDLEVHEHHEHDDTMARTPSHLRPAIEDDFCLNEDFWKKNSGRHSTRHENQTHPLSGGWIATATEHRTRPQKCTVRTP